MSDYMTADNANRLDGLFRLHADRVFRLAYRRTGNRHIAEDVAGETWLRAANWVGTLQSDDESAFGWLAAILRHAVADYYRPAKAREVPTDWADPISGRDLPTSPPADVVALGEATSAPTLPEAMLAAIGQLPPTEQAALLWRCEGMSWKAVGSHTGRDRSYVARAARRGAETLRPLIASEAVSV